MPLRTKVGGPAPIGYIDPANRWGPLPSGAEFDSGERLAYVWRNILADNFRLKQFAENP